MDPVHRRRPDDVFTVRTYGATSTRYDPRLVHKSRPP